MQIVVPEPQAQGWKDFYLKINRYIVKMLNEPCLSYYGRSSIVTGSIFCFVDDMQEDIVQQQHIFSTPRV